MNKEAIILVDIQNDFINGSLAIDSSEAIIAPINKLIKNANLVIASFDFHPQDHISFVENGGKWPSHCVKDTYGSLIHEGINKKEISTFIYKGENKGIEEYSVFNGKNKEGESLDDILKSNKISNLIVAGLALDCCVWETILDALSIGYKVKVYKNTVEATKDKDIWLKKLIDKGVEVI